MEGDLIVLDDFAHLLPDGAASVQALLDAAPNTKILVTAQTPLGLAVEQTLPVQPLAVPPATLASVDALRGYPCVAIVLHHSGDRFRLTAQNARPLARACAALNGHPGDLVKLGLCLSQNPNALYSGQIRAVQRAGGAPPNRQGRQHCVSDILREEELRILRCLLSFDDAFDAADAAAASKISLTEMESFLHIQLQSSLIQRTENLQRYRIHPQVRSAIPPLTAQQRQTVKGRLHIYYTQQLQQMCESLPREQIRQWCYVERNALLAVLDYLANDALYTELVRFLELLHRACASRPPAMLLDWGYQYATQKPAMSTEAYQSLVHIVSLGLVNCGESAKARELTHSREVAPASLGTIARAYHNSCEMEQAYKHYEQAAIYAEVMDLPEEAIINALNAAESEAVIGNLKLAGDILDGIQNRFSFWRLPDYVRSWFHFVGGYVSYQRGRFLRSREQYLKSAELGAHANSAHRELSRVYLELGDYEQAEAYAKRGIEQFYRDPEPVAESLHALEACLGDLYAVLGRYDNALRYHYPALEFWQQKRQPRWTCWMLNRLAEIELLARDAGHQWRLTQTIGRSAHDLLQEASQLTQQAPIGLPHESRTLYNLGWLAWHEGRLEDAEQYLTRALAIRQSYENEYGVSRTLEIQARLRYSQQRYDEARNLLRHSGSIRKKLKVKPYPAVKQANLSSQRTMQRRRTRLW